MKIFSYLRLSLPLVMTLLLATGCDVDNRLKKAGSDIGKFGSTTAKKVGRSVETGVKKTQRTANKFVKWVKEKASPEQKRVAKKRGKKASDRYASSGKKTPRYIAVDAPLGPEGPRGPERQTVMLYDTKAGETLGSSVYNLDERPRKGEAVRIDGKDVEYVGQ